MSYYQVVSGTNTPITKMLLDKRITFFVGNDNECHLNIPDDRFLYCLAILKGHFDVAIVERIGKDYIWLDQKGGLFQKNQLVGLINDAADHWRNGNPVHAGSEVAEDILKELQK